MNIHSLRAMAAIFSLPWDIPIYAPAPAKYGTIGHGKRSNAQVKRQAQTRRNINKRQPLRSRK